MANLAAVRIEGFNEFKRNLKALDADLAKVLKLALNDVAEIVVVDTQRRMPSRTGRARRSVVGRSTLKGARVQEGGRTAGYVPWLDFGGQIGRASGKARGRRGSRSSVGADGRYLYPAYYRARDSGEITTAATKALIQVAAAAGIEVT